MSGRRSWAVPFSRSITGTGRRRSRLIAFRHRPSLRGRHCRGAPLPPAGMVSGLPLRLDAELLELCSHRHKPALEDADDMVANLGRREGYSVYESTPTIDFILGTDDQLIGIAIYSDEALGLLDLFLQIIDRHGLPSMARVALAHSSRMG